MELTTHNIISIVQIILFLPFLAISIVLCVRHGFGQNAGWFFLVIFSLSRIIGASLQLATIAQPHNVSLQVGVLTLQSVGFSDFIVMLLAIINRALEGVEKARGTVVDPRILRYLQLFVFVGLILTAIGGPNSGTQYTVSSVYQAGVGLTLAGFALLVVATAVIGLNVSYAEPGEKRIVLAVALSLPFLLVRSLYTAIGTFQPSSAFNLARGNIYIFLGTAVIEEIIIVLIIEVMGLTLRVKPKTEAPSAPGGGLLVPLAKRLFKNAKRRFEGNYEPRRSDGAQGRRERRYKQGYEMQTLHRNSDSVSIA